MRLRRALAVSLFLLPFCACSKRTSDALRLASSANAIASSANAMAGSANAMGSSAQGVASTMSQAVVSGDVHSVGGDVGTWDIVLADCQSGEINGFYGADFYVAGNSDMRLRYVHDEAKGEIVKVPIPPKLSDVRVLTRDTATCTVLDGSIEKTNVSVWTPKGTIRQVKGHVKFDCKQTGGKDHISGEVTFSRCAVSH